MMLPITGQSKLGWSLPNSISWDRAKILNKPGWGICNWTSTSLAELTGLIRMKNRNNCRQSKKSWHIYLNTNFINIRNSQWCLLESAWYFLTCILIISRVTTADNVTAPTMVPSTRPANAPLLKPELGESAPSVTLMKSMSTSKIKAMQQYSSHIWINERKEDLTSHSSSICGVQVKS